MMRILSILFILASFTSVAQTVQTIGSPGTRVNSRGDFISDSILYLPRTQVTSRSPFQSGAIRYQPSDSSVYQWTGTAWRRVSGTVDSLLYSTRAWRQKGDDSIAAIINTRTDTLLVSTRAWRQKGLDSLARLEVSVSDTSTMLSPYVRAAGFGLTKSGQSLLADSASMATRARVQKGIDSVAALSRVGGSGTTNYVPKFTASSTLGNSKLFDDGTNLFYNQTTQTYRRVTGLEFSNGFFYVKRNANVASLGLLGLRDSVATNVGGSIEFQATYRNSDGDPTEIARINGYRENATDLNTAGFLTINTKTGAGALTEAIRVNSSQESLFAIADAGNYRIQADGSIYNTGDAILAASSGAVSIGTTSTSNKLTVNSTGFGTAQYVYSTTATEGPMIITGNNASLGSSTINMVLRSYNASFVGSLFGQSVAGYTLIGSDGSSSNGMLLGAVTNDPIIIGTNNTERARITADGEALFGTTTDAGDYRVQVNGNGYFAGGIVTTLNSLINSLSLGRGAGQDIESIAFGRAALGSATTGVKKQCVGRSSTFVYNNGKRQHRNRQGGRN